MRQFDFYEFVGIIVPGTVAVVVIEVAFTGILELFGPEGLSLGEFGLGVILAYAAGHVVQGFGNLLEKAWWKLWGGMPTDWVGSGSGSPLCAEQAAALKRCLPEMLGLPQIALGEGKTPAGWYSITRQVNALVARAGQAGRIETFNGNYGLCRGLAASFLLGLMMVMLESGFTRWQLIIILVAATVMSVYRMHRFGVHYGRELFVQFLALPDCKALDGVRRGS